MHTLQFSHAGCCLECLLVGCMCIGWQQLASARRIGLKYDNLFLHQDGAHTLIIYYVIVSSVQSINAAQVLSRKQHCMPHAIIHCGAYVLLSVVKQLFQGCFCADLGSREQVSC